MNQCFFGKMVKKSNHHNVCDDSSPNGPILCCERLLKDDFSIQRATPPYISAFVGSNVCLLLGLQHCQLVGWSAAQIVLDHSRVVCA